MKRSKEIIRELKNHSPLTALATLIAVVATIFILKTSWNLEVFFESTHALHIVVSAIVTAGIFHKYEPKFFKAIFVGIVGAIFIGSISDVLVPYLGALIFMIPIEFHLPIIENPLLILGAALVGSFLGVTTHYTKFPHFTHVFLSVFASLFYLLIFSQAFGFFQFSGAFLIVFISVIIPCCLSDVIFPFLFISPKIKHCGCK